MITKSQIPDEFLCLCGLAAIERETGLELKTKNYHRVTKDHK